MQTLGDALRGQTRKEEWRRHVADVVAGLIAALEPDGPADNGNAFVGGLRLWEEAAGRQEEDDRCVRPHHALGYRPPTPGGRSGDQEPASR
jgi:hypothetical protein